jgi:hypothetical protein
MHMLRDEDNAKYRQVMKNTLEFDPQVIKRYVNFMNNPDEKSAAEQFGDSDKYFGVCILMATLPGLPMMGHGQIEGYREKYGMEFRHAMWEEQPNEGLIKGHEWKVFPILHHRRVFAGSEDFLLYDFFTPNGTVNEDVFAHSNRLGDERGLVIYHNKYAETRGWVKTSSAYMDKGAGRLVQKALAEGLSLPHDGFAIFRDYVTHLEYIRSCRELWEKGLFVNLSGYQSHAFLDWRFVNDDQGNWQKVHEQLNGSCVPSIQEKYDEVFAARAVVSEQVIRVKKKLTCKTSTSRRPAAKKPVKSSRKASQEKSTVRKKK